MKRIIALLLCLITVFALASCGEEKNNDNTDTTVEETEKTLIDAAPLDIMDAIVSSYTDIPDYKTALTISTTDTSSPNMQDISTRANLRPLPSFPWSIPTPSAFPTARARLRYTS